MTLNGVMIYRKLNYNKFTFFMIFSCAMFAHGLFTVTC